MSELNQEEQELLNRLKNPVVKFYTIQKEIDRLAREQGYENYRDFLISTGWFNRFEVLV